MKIAFAALFMMSAAQGFTHMERPIEDNFVWVSAADNGGTLRRVEVKRTNKLVSPGVFNQRRWDLIQACLGINSNADQWYEDAPHPHYKADLQMLQTGAKEDPCDELD